jgi:MFS family permease
MLATLAQPLIWAQALAVVGCLIGGLGNGLVVVQSSTLLQLLAPSDLLGRLGGWLQSSFVAGQLFAIFTTPFLVPARLPIGTYFGIAALALLLVALSSALLLRRRPLQWSQTAAGS